MRNTMMGMVENSCDFYLYRSDFSRREHYFVERLKKKEILKFEHRKLINKASFWM